MRRAAFSVFVFGTYLLLLGAMLALAPNMLLGLLGFPRTNEVRIRLPGVLIATIG